MRLSLFVSLAALSASATSDSYDDDDLNFLRLLSSNATNTTMAPTTTTPANTTTTAANTTTTAANTTMAPTTATPANTTTAPADTTVAATTTPANTTAAATTVADTTAAATTAAPSQNTTAAPVDTTGASGDTTAAASQAPETTTMPSKGGEYGATLCSAENYAMLDLLAPPGFANTNATWGLSCPTLPSFTNDATSVYTWGPMAGSEGNAAKCTDSSLLECGTSLGYGAWQEQAADLKKSILSYCCGKPSGFSTGMDLAGANAGGTFMMGYYTDNACSTAATLPSDASRRDTLLWSAGTEKAIDVGTCFNDGYADLFEIPGVNTIGSHNKIVMSNGTVTDNTPAANSKILVTKYFDDQCMYPILSLVVDQMGCTAAGRRRLQEGNQTDGGAGGTYSKMLVTGGAAVTEKVIKSTTTSAFDNSALTGVEAGSPEAAEIRTAVGDAARDALEAAVASIDGAQVTVVATGTGKLAAERRRRLSERRQLAGHMSSVIVESDTVIPAAEAAAAKTAMDTASASGDLAPAALQTAIATKMQASTVLADAGLANLTATVSVDIQEPVVALPATTSGGGGGGSTSGAANTFLGLGVATMACLTALLL